MKIIDRLAAQPTPPREYVLVLDKEELFHLYVLSHTKEGGDSFPAIGRFAQILERRYPWLIKEFDIWSDAGRPRLPSVLSTL